MVFPLIFTRFVGGERVSDLSAEKHAFGNSV